MKRRAFQETPAFLAGCGMPRELRHRKRGRPFDPRASEVFRWIAGQPELMQFVFDHLRYAGAIRFDRVTRTWRGVRPADAMTSPSPRAATAPPTPNGQLRGHATTL